MKPSSVARCWLWRWLPSLGVALAGIVGCAVLWWQQTQATQEVAQARLERRAGDVAQALQTRMGAYDDLLQGMRNLLVLDPQLTRAQFERAAVGIDLQVRHPGVRNVHFTRWVVGAERTAFEARARADAHLDGSLPRDFAIHPPQERSDYYVVDFFWPLQGNDGLLGLENHSQPANLESMERARDSARLVASAPFDIVQASSERTGIIVRLPVFADGAAQSGGPHFLGAVGVTLRMRDVVNAMRASGQLQDMALALDDVGLAGLPQPQPAMALLGDGPVAPAQAEPARFMVQVGGRQWRLQLWPTASLLSPSEARQPAVLAGGALALVLLLTALVSLLVLRRAQAQALAERSEAVMHESEGRTRALFRQAGVGIVQVRVDDGRIVRVNPKFCAIVGYDERTLLHMRFQDVTDARDLPANLQLLARLQAGELDEAQMEKRYLHRDGHVVWTELTVSPLRVEGQHLQHVISVVQDISERRRVQQLLERSEERLRGILEHMPVGVCQVVDGQFLYMNEHHTRITGFSLAQVGGVDGWWESVIADAHERRRIRGAWEAACNAARDEVDGAIRPIEFVLTSRAGFRRSVELSGVVVGQGYISVLVDHSLRKEAEAEVQHLAYNDLLTGLPNRRLVLERLQQALALSARHKRCGAVLMLDLDHFKTINETRGHAVGDRLLREVAQRLRDCLHAEDTLARQGGDEFIVLLGNLDADPQAAANRAEERGSSLLRALQRPIQLDCPDEIDCKDCDHIQHHVTLSLGIAVFHGQEVSADELLKRSDIAMYEAKAAGRNTLRFYDPQMQAAVSARAALEADMRAGLQQGQFVLFYQPKVQRGRVVGAEALLRWRHPERGFVSPAQFIPLAEDCGLILPLGQWVLASACAQLARWSADPLLARLSVAVNVSPRQFHEDDFVAQVLAALAASGAPARRLKLELTEGLLLHNVEDTIAKMEQLRGHGVGFSLDDFGTGYSSLSYLKRLPLQELKIDQSFVRDVLTDPNDAAIARTIIALGASLGLSVVAEGVETQAQRAFLEQSGCDTWQGYLLSPPVPAPDYEALVRRRAETLV